MGLNSETKSNRVHIGIFGRTNSGKSSIINSITNQELSIVSDIEGTTTDPVYKAMELLPIGPVIFIDTAGIDDISVLGKKRAKKTNDVLNKVDVAIVVIDGKAGLSIDDINLINCMDGLDIPYLVAINKIDIVDDSNKIIDEINANEINNYVLVSASTGENMDKLKEDLAELTPTDLNRSNIISDKLEQLDLVVLVIPIDKGAPKGRLIYPQHQTIRDILDVGAIPIITRDTELVDMLKSLVKKPKLVITDSQVFKFVDSVVQKDIMITSFSVLFSRYRGDLEENIRAALAVESLKDGDCVLISEGCTHHRQCEDIGTVKIPRMLDKYLNADNKEDVKTIKYEFTSGNEFPTDLSKYKLVIHCGACLLNYREMQHRIKVCKNGSIPITNYGILMAYLNGILDRCTEVFN